MRPAEAPATTREGACAPRYLFVGIKFAEHAVPGRLAVIESVLVIPNQKLPEHGDVVCYQSKVEINRKPYLIRVMVNEKTAKVVTVYRTSKINKYWKI